MTARNITLEGTDVGDAALAVWRMLMDAQSEAAELVRRGRDVPSTLTDKIARLTLLERRLERATNGDPCAK